MNAKKFLSRFKDKRHIEFSCSECGQDYYIDSGEPGIIVKAKRLAQECCVGGYCVRCGKGRKGFDLVGTHCPQCIEFNLVKKAQHIKWNDYEGRALFTEDAPSRNGGYYFDDDLREQCEDNDVELPCYVYACNLVPFEPDILAYIESRFEDHTGCAEEIDGFKDNDQLYALCKKFDEWASKQPFVYEEDLKRVIVLDDKRFQQYLQKNDQKTCNIK